MKATPFAKRGLGSASILVLGALMCPVFLGTNLWGGPGDDPESNEEHEEHDHVHRVEIPGLEISPWAVDFDKVYVGEEPIKQVVLSNTSEKPLTLRKIYSGCGCAIPRIVFSTGEVVEISKQGVRSELGVIAPGEQARLEVRFVTHGYHGKIHKHISIESDHDDFPYFKIAVLAQIEDAITLEPTAFDFGDVIRGQQIFREIVLKSTGIGAFELAGFENLPAFMRYQVETVVQPRGADPAEHAVRLQLRLQGDFPLGESKFLLFASIRHGRVKSLRLPVRMNVQPKVIFRNQGKFIGSNLDFGVFPRRLGKQLTVEIVNLAPTIPYDVLDVFVNGKLKPYLEVELVPLEEGTRYELRIQVKPGHPKGYARGSISLVSDHQDMMLKKIRLLGYAFDSK